MANDLSPTALRARAKEFRTVPRNHIGRWIRLGSELAGIEKDLVVRRIPAGEAIVKTDPGLKTYLDALKHAHAEIVLCLGYDDEDLRGIVASHIFDAERENNDDT